MFWLIEFKNPFQHESLQKSQVPSGITIRQLADRLNGIGKEFEYPTICYLNGKVVLRAQWSEIVLKDKDILSFMAVQGYIGALVAAIVLTVISIAISLLMPVPKVNQQQGAADPVYSLAGSGNQMRLSQPIEVNYGLNRIYPSYAARPYYEYQSNNQYQFSLLCIGQGLYDISAVQIGDSPIANYTEAEYEIITPGNPVTLFPTNVYTSPEAGGQTLLGPNEADYPIDEGGFTGPFVVCPSGAQVVQIEIDLAMPNGLYSMDSKGKVNPTSVIVEAQYRPIDDAGNPTGDGSWTDLLSPAQEAIQMATITPQRLTYSIPVTLGRYEVQMRRANDYVDSAQVGDTVVWDGMRGWINTTPSYGNVTLLAVRIQATNNLNNQTQQLINVIATRKLPIRDQTTGVWSAPTATRSIIWAYVDLFKATYGGRISDDVFFDWDTFYALDVIYAERGNFFDWTFNDSDTVWDAAQMIALAGRAIPLITGSLISLKRDVAQSVPVALFNQENILQGSFTWGLKMWGDDEFDSLLVTYVEPTTGYVAETVLCVLPGDAGDNPDTLTLSGVLDRTNAYHEGMYRLACIRYLRETFTFQTGLEGYIPVYGDLIGIVHDVPKWGQGGFIVNAVQTGNSYQLWTSEPLTFTEGATHQVWLRSKNGGTLGTFVARQTQDEKQVVIMTNEEIDFQLDGLTEPMLYMFGPVGQEMKMVRITDIEPQGLEAIQISGVNNSSIPYSFDNLEAPALEEDFFVPDVPDLPVVASVTLSQLNSTNATVNISWPSAFGAQQYIVQTSYDNINWGTAALTVNTSLLLAVQNGTFYVRVAGINVGQGPYATNDLDIGSLAGLNLTVPWDDVTWSINWLNVLNEVGWQVRVYDNTVPATPVLKNTTNPASTDPRTFTYDYPQAVTDGNLHRNMLVEVDVKFEADDGSGPALSGTPASLALTNSIPLPPTGLTTGTPTLDSISAHYVISWTVPPAADLIRVKLWLSIDPNFDATVESPVYDFTAGSPGTSGIPVTTNIAIDLDSASGHVEYYYKVALFDVWGNEITTNLSVRASIAAI